MKTTKVSFPRVEVPWNCDSGREHAVSTRTHFGHSSQTQISWRIGRAVVPVVGGVQKEYDQHECV